MCINEKLKKKYSNFISGQDNGETCVTKEWCKVTGAVCDTICKCETGFYSNGFSCIESK